MSLNNNGEPLLHGVTLVAPGHEQARGDAVVRNQRSIEKTPLTPEIDTDSQFLGGVLSSNLLRSVKKYDED